MPDDSTLARELLSGHKIMVNTKGISMRPLLWQGRTQVMVSPLTRPLEVGDLPLVSLPDGRFRLHRLVKKEGDVLCTRGDNTIALERVKPEDVVGVVTEIYRGPKKINMNGRGYRFYTRLWLKTAPVRLPIYRLRQIVLGMARRMVRYVRDFWK